MSEDLEKKDHNLEDKIEKSGTKIVIKRRVKILFFCLFTILLISISGFLIFQYYQNLNKVTFDSYHLYQYFSGIRYDYKGSVTLEKGNKITSIKNDDLEINAESIPIYFQNIDNQVIFPSEMGLIFPELKNKNYRVRYFSEIILDTSDSGDSALLKMEKKNEYLRKCFLYDGEDLYFFPYETEVTIDGKKYKLSPLSYVIVNYKENIEIYNKSKDEYIIIEEHEDDVIALVDQYQVNLSNDMILYGETEKRLLFKNINKLELYKG